MTALARPARSYLYVPGDRPDRLAGARGRGADALIADLEDAVPLATKAAARRHVAAWVAARAGDPVQTWVRINADSIEADVEAVLGRELDGVVLPKGEPERLHELDAVLSAAEHRAGRPIGSLAVLPLIETATGLLRAAEVAAAPRVVRLGLGEVDLAAELGLQPSADRHELTALRLQVVVASAAARIARPVGPTSIDFRDLAAFRQSSTALLRLGFRARTAIHPAQLAVIHEVFTPTGAELQRARDVVARLDAAGGGVALDADGRLIDSAVARSARELVAGLDAN